MILIQSNLVWYIGKFWLLSHSDLGPHISSYTSLCILDILSNLSDGFLKYKMGLGKIPTRQKC